jgi:hypothetical protein
MQSLRGTGPKPAKKTFAGFVKHILNFAVLIVIFPEINVLWVILNK